MTVRPLTWGDRDAYRALHSSDPQSDVQQSWGWIRALGRLEEHDLGGVVWEKGGRLLAALPGFVKRTAAGRAFVSLPYPDAYGGVLASPAVDQTLAYRSVLYGLLSYTREAAIDVVHIGQRPFSLDGPQYIRWLRPTAVQEEAFAFMTLDAGPLGLVPGKRRREFLREVAKARRAGVEVSESQDAGELRQWFTEILRPRFAEVGGPAPPVKLCVSIFEELAPSTNAKLLLARHEGEIVGGGLLLVSNRVGNLYEACTRREWMKDGVAKLVDYTAVQLAVARGCRYFNWADSPTPGIESYKMGWGSVRGFRHRYIMVGSTSERASRIEENLMRTQPHYLSPPATANGS